MKQKVNNSYDIFSKMSTLNKLSLAFFINAKIFGLCGVSLGFLDSSYHIVGGFFLVIAMISIFMSIIFSLKQSSLDKIKFEAEDEEKRTFKNLLYDKEKLQKEILDLEDKKKFLNDLMIRKI